MKYSIRGKLLADSSSNIVKLINKYTLWRLVAEQTKDIDGIDLFIFEVWLNNKLDKVALFNELKPFVGRNDELIDWHECSHDEEYSQPCVIAEEYRGE